MDNKLSSQQWQLLSASLDNQLTQKEKRQVEELLQQSADAREALAALRRTRIILRALPLRKAPRNFILTPETVKKPLIPTFNALLRFSSAMAALLLVVVLALDFIGLSAPVSTARVAEDAATETLAMKATAAEEGEAPQIIFWGGPPVAFGMGGGGGDGFAYGMGGGAEGPGFGIGGGDAGPGYVSPIAPLPEAVPLEEGLPLGEEMLLPEGEAPSVGAEPVSPMPEFSTASEQLTGTGPILGVPPLEEQGKVRTLSGEEMPARGTCLPVSLRTIEIILAALLVLTAIPAWLLRRK